MSAVRDPTVLGLVLAGGLGRRMGGIDKPLAMLAGQSLLDRVVERMAPQCAAGLMLSANGDPARFAAFPGPVIPDSLPGRLGPLAGILAGLDHAAATRPHVNHVVSVPADAPFLPTDLVTRLRDGLSTDTAITFAESGGRGHYTVALWPVAIRTALRAALVEADERRAGKFLSDHGAVAVVWPAAPRDSFLNVNTPEELADAERGIREIGC